MQNWPQTHTIHLAPDYAVELPLLDIGDGFRIYSFDMTGEAEWNRVAARELLKKLEPYAFDGIVTVQTKSCGLAQAISAKFPRYLELRKSRKSFMVDPKGVTVQSITTHGQQELWIGREKYRHFQGKKLCFLDDVVSTGGTIEAAFALAKRSAWRSPSSPACSRRDRSARNTRAFPWSASTTSPCRARNKPATSNLGLRKNFCRSFAASFAV